MSLNRQHNLQLVHIPNVQHLLQVTFPISSNYRTYLPHIPTSTDSHSCLPFVVFAVTLAHLYYNYSDVVYILIQMLKHLGILCIHCVRPYLLHPLNHSITLLIYICGGSIPLFTAQDSFCSRLYPTPLTQVKMQILTMN